MREFLWAKKNRVDNVPMWLPLMVHLNDTMEVCGLLWEHWFSQGVKDFLYDAIQSDIADKEELLKNLCKFLGAAHDIGKASPAFQVKESFYRDQDLDDLMIE